MDITSDGLDILGRLYRPTLPPEANPRRARLAGSRVTAVPETSGRLTVLDGQDLLPHGYVTRALVEIRGISTGHAATSMLPGTATADEELAALRSVHASHQKRLRGPAYHRVVVPSGRVYFTGAW